MNCLSKTDSTIAGKETTTDIPAKRSPRVFEEKKSFAVQLYFEWGYYHT